ncbi:S53 family peptidase [Candidatus Frankia alpina]|uniref:Peptidase S53 domain-containing protein n=1 Tax=Candidatus Frankia alpina TaxID=2699483 RepID=A0A4S5BWD4_9ACTN|nr:S53 family peptidase [Candidatus Frankia alpina]THJ36929.1 hypothetical protein E7Y31_21855 [Candidatus Frankia alpina]
MYLDGYTGGNPNEESAADIELVISMAPDLDKVIIYGAPYSNAGIVDALHEMAKPTKGEPFPHQITTSYYFFYDKNVYDALTRLAIQGQALFVASGDFGAYNETSGSGAFPPSDHPLVTSVGGTELQTSGPGGVWISETAAWFSGGGYSHWGSDPQFAIPWWQAGMDYTVCKGSATVRNAPDVSIVAENIEVFSNGSWNSFAGTSAAAPLWAGFMALANEQAAALGRPRIRFANPALWAIGRDRSRTYFHDITTGSNFNSANPSLYSAVAGYDLVARWGTPNGSDLIDALVAYGIHRVQLPYIYDILWWIKTHGGLLPPPPPAPWRAQFAAAVDLTAAASRVSPQMRPDVLELTLRQLSITIEGMKKEIEALRRTWE